MIRRPPRSTPFPTRRSSDLTDPAGNSSTSNPISVIVDNTAPNAGTLSFTGLTDTGSQDSPTPITTDGTFDLNLAGDHDANGVTVAYEVSTSEEPRVGKECTT